MKVNDVKINSLVRDILCKMVDEGDTESYYQIFEAGNRKWYLLYSNPFCDIMAARVELYVDEGKNNGFDLIESYKLVDCSPSTLLEGGNDLLSELAEWIRIGVLRSSGL